MKKNLLTTFIMIMMFTCTFEVVSAFYYYVNLKTFYSPMSIAQNVTGQNWKADSVKNFCEFSSRFWGPHPYFGYSRTELGNENCDLKDVVNNSGMAGPDYPVKKNPDEFVVMVTGGSVAENFSIKRSITSENQLTEYLNERFYPPRGKIFKVIAGSLGDYRFPQSLLVPILHHDVIDGIIDLSGYNESRLYLTNEKLESPSTIYYQLFDYAKEKLNNESIRSSALWLQNSYCKYSYSCVFFIEKWILNKAKQKVKLIDSMSVFRKNFLYPDSVKDDDRFQERVSKHQGYYRIFSGMCQTMNYKCAFFLQPIPQLYKNLTSIEKTLIRNEHPNTGIIYKKMTDKILELQKENVPVFSLLDSFKEEAGQVYSDQIHFQYDYQNQIFRGHDIVSKRIADKIAELWKLKPKKQ